MSSKMLILTMGDPVGIGPEITAKFLHLIYTNQFSLHDHRLKVIGHIPLLREIADRLGYGLPGLTSGLKKESGQNNIPDAIDYCSIDSGLPGQVAYQSIIRAVEEIAASSYNQAHILITGPISKENLHQAGISYSGHTEILQALANRPDLFPPHPESSYQSDMLFLYRRQNIPDHSRPFRMLLLTRHVSLKDVSHHLTVPGVTRSITNLIRFLQDDAKIPHPRICLLGVNPHAGEICGQEEQEVLLPAIEKLSRAFSVTIPPPFPADALFRGFDVENIPYDAYVAAYHDQGLIPFKLIAGLDAVNITIGLPFLRTSVSHGTANDIAGRDIASPNSLIEAVKTAQALI